MVSSLLPMKRAWPKLALVASVALIAALMIVWHKSSGPSTRGISSFEFVNLSDRVVSNLDLDFSYLVADAEGGIEQQTRQFSRSFPNLNLPPGRSVVVQCNTPALMLTSLMAGHRPTVSHFGTNVIEGPYWSSYDHIVTATPDHDITLSFVSPGKIIADSGRRSHQGPGAQPFMTQAPRPLPMRTNGAP